MPKLLNSRTLKQSLLALTFNIGGLMSGGIAAAFFPAFDSVSWLLLLFPAILSVRGSIGGIFVGRLSTMLHLGDIEPRLSGNTRRFYSLLKAILFLTFTDTICIGIFAFLINLLLGNTTIEQLPLFAAVPVFTCLLAMVVAIPIVSFVGMMGFKKGLDPDILLYPVMSTVDDIVVTLCYIAVVSLTVIPGFIAIMFIAMVFLAGLFLAMFLKNRGDGTFMRTFREGAPTVLLSSLLAILSGIALENLKEEIGAYPSVLILYPALIDTLGDIGSILGSMETTRLALGYAQSLRAAIRQTMSDLASVETAAGIMHIAYGFVAFSIGSATGLDPNLRILVSVALISNLFSFAFIAVFSLIVATQTFKHGLDPDNFVIPMVTSFSDLGATLSLGVALAILRLRLM